MFEIKKFIECGWAGDTTTPKEEGLSFTKIQLHEFLVSKIEASTGLSVEDFEIEPLQKPDDKLPLIRFGKRERKMLEAELWKITKSDAMLIVDILGDYTTTYHLDID